MEATSQRAFEAGLDLIVGVMEPLTGDKLEAGYKASAWTWGTSFWKLCGGWGRSGL